VRRRAVMSIELPKKDLSQRYRTHEAKEEEKLWKDTSALPQNPTSQMGKNSELTKEQALKKLKAAKVQAISKVRHVNKVDPVDEIGGGEEEGLSSRTRRAESPSPAKDLQQFCQPDRIDPKWFHLDQFKSMCGSLQESLITIENPELREKMLSRAQNLLGEEIQARSLLQSYMNALVMV
jgi:hypothetical protein